MGGKCVMGCVGTAFATASAKLHIHCLDCSAGYCQGYTSRLVQYGCGCQPLTPVPFTASAETKPRML